MRGIVSFCLISFCHPFGTTNFRTTPLLCDFCAIELLNAGKINTENEKSKSQNAKVSTLKSFLRHIQVNRGRNHGIA